MVVFPLNVICLGLLVNFTRICPIVKARFQDDNQIELLCSIDIGPTSPNGIEIGYLQLMS